MSSLHATRTTWLLERYDHDGERVADVVVDSSPFTVGRDDAATLKVDDRSVSKRHAELTFSDDQLQVRDLGSTNGTFVNGRPIRGAATLNDRDLLQFANVVYRVAIRAGRDTGTHRDATGTLVGASLGWARQLVEFDKLIEGRGLEPHLQPIVRLAGGACFGYESLARSTCEGLESAEQMFSVASKLNAASDLSRLLRRRTVERTAQTLKIPNLFLNTHPDELATIAVADSLDEIRKLAPTQRITIEIHESAVTRADVIDPLVERIQSLNMQLAFDDFGSGQARLQELTEYPADFVKFDMRMIRGIDRAGPRRRQLISALVQMLHDLDIQSFAEGVETQEEAAICQEIGFDYGQGYLFGRPLPVAEVLDA